MNFRYRIFLLYFTRDILLLEAGFLTILVAPFNIQLPRKFRMPIYHEHDTIVLWLVKWLLFRLMFASGVVKLTSGCPTWWGLTGKLLIITSISCLYKHPNPSFVELGRNIQIEMQLKLNF